MNLSGKPGSIEVPLFHLTIDTSLHSIQPIARLVDVEVSGGRSSRWFFQLCGGLDLVSVRPAASSLDDAHGSRARLEGNLGPEFGCRGDGGVAAVCRIYAESLASRDASFETEVPTVEELNAKWTAEHRRIAVVNAQVGVMAAITPTAVRVCYRGVAEYRCISATVGGEAAWARRSCTGRSTAANAAGMCSPQTSNFPENRVSLSLHHSVGFPS